MADEKVGLTFSGPNGYRVMFRVCSGIFDLPITLCDVDMQAEMIEEENCANRAKDSVDGNVMAKAKFAFTANAEDELSFQKGAIIVVTRELEGGWWEGTLDEKTGWFPSNYVRQIKKGDDEKSSQKLKETESVPEYYSQVLQELLESEKLHVDQMESFYDRYIQPMETSDVLSAGDVQTLCGNLSDVIAFQKTFHCDLQAKDKLPHSRQMIGNTFLHHLTQFQDVYETFCSNHPWAVAVLTDNQDKLGSYMEEHGSSSPGLLTLTMNLSQPFRRLEKYSSTLLELYRQIEDKHKDKLNLEEAAKAFDNFTEKIKLIRKRKEMEFEMVTKTLEGLEGQQSLSENGKCVIMVPVTEHLSDGGYDDRFLLLFPHFLVILSVSSSLSGYRLEHRYLVSEGQMKILHDISPNTVEFAVGNERLRFTCSLAHDREQLQERWDMTHNSSVSSIMMRRPSAPNMQHRMGSIFSKASSSTGLNAAAAKLFNKKQSGSQLGSISTAQQVQITRPKHWSFRSLRPLPPIKPNISYKTEETPRSPKLGKKSKTISSKMFGRSRKEDSGKKQGEGSLQDDDCILKVIEAYCYSARMKTVASLSYDDPTKSRVPLSPPPQHHYSRSSCQLAAFFSDTAVAQEDFQADN
ncbi:rho guanine nucleotide exchange factor 7-like isoform X2 [Corticium candelabrum]|uniref:rho guanine nucleotide exchange factor 7-like isoform X2 n=1 Tax=Corticium candelabrum TaxID=121492 RepID=UPI002E25CC9B|nr:rho guanine nucleotide exchange factor 7-like isoform X2 [Corticium candelabrum]